MATPWTFCTFARVVSSFTGRNRSWQSPTPDTVVAMCSRDRHGPILLTGAITFRFANS